MVKQDFLCCLCHDKVISELVLAVIEVLGFSLETFSVSIMKVDLHTKPSG